MLYLWWQMAGPHPPVFSLMNSWGRNELDLLPAFRVNPLHMKQKLPLMWGARSPGALAGERKAQGCDRDRESVRTLALRLLWPVEWRLPAPTQGQNADPSFMPVAESALGCAFSPTFFSSGPGVWSCSPDSLFCPTVCLHLCKIRVVWVKRSLNSNSFPP